MRKKPLEKIVGWEREKMMVTSIFSLSRNVFLFLRALSYHFSDFKLSSANALNLDQTFCYMVICLLIKQAQILCMGPQVG